MRANRLLQCGLALVGVCLGASGCGSPSLLLTPVANAYSLDETVVVGGKGFFPSKIAIIGVEGMLMNARSGGLLEPTENAMSLFVQQLDKAADDPQVKAVVLRVNSPGGTVSASDAMYELVQRFKSSTHKPVIAAAQELDASGAYYVSCAADKIVAQPTSIVGSIGVIFETFDLQGTMSKLGIRPGNYKSAAHKDIGSPFRDPTPDEQAIMQNLVDQYYARFRSVVSTNRHLSTDPATYTMLTDGRIFSGEQALELGLVDKIGLLDDAIKLAKQTAHAESAEVVQYRRPYGYGGSIYALNSAPLPQQSNTLQLQLPEAATLLPTGFYYLWQP
jgi:protease-4